MPAISWKSNLIPMVHSRDMETCGKEHSGQKI